MNTSSITDEITNPGKSIGSTIADVGAALLFGLGFYFFRNKLKKNKEEPDMKDKLKPFKEKLEDAINDWESSISIQKINNLIKTEVTDKTFDPFVVLDQMQKSSIQPDISTINALLDTTSRLKDHQNFNRLLELICSETVQSSLPSPNIITYNIILKGINVELFRKDRDVDKNEVILKTEKVIKHMSQNEARPNDITLNTIIDIMVDSKNFDQAWKYFDEMEIKYQIEPDIYTYSTLIKSIKNYEPDNKNIERVFEILKKIKLSTTKGIKPDEILYNCILDTCVKYGRIKQAEKIYTDMTEAGITPSKITYAIMIKAYGNEYNLEKSMEVFNQMKINGIQANEIIYGCLLNAAIKCNKIDHAMSIFEEMKVAKIPMNIVLYSTLIKGYARSKNFEKAFEIYNQLMEDELICPNTISYNAILDCCVECGDFKMMNSIYESFKASASENESNPQPDLITYSTVIKGYCKMKNVEKVLDIYNYLKGREDFTLDEVMFNTILDGLLKAEKYDEALKIYDHMKSRNLKKSNATYSILIKIFSKLGFVEKAVEIYNEMIESGIKPSLITYTSILQILIKSKRIQNAMEIFDEILSNDLLPDQVMFNVIINGCVFNGKLNEACKYMFKSFENNIKLCEDVYKNVLCNLLTNKLMNFDYKIELTMKLCKELKTRGVKIDYELYYKVMKMVYRNNGRKADSCAQKETEEYKSYINEKFKNQQTNNGYKKTYQTYNTANNYTDPKSIYSDSTKNNSGNGNNYDNKSWRKKDA